MTWNYLEHVPSFKYFISKFQVEWNILLYSNIITVILLNRFSEMEQYFLINKQRILTPNHSLSIKTREDIVWQLLLFPVPYVVFCISL